MALSDSTEKIMSYIKASQNDELIISPMFFRDYTCPSHCGGCCPKFSLDYFEGERWELFKTTYPDLVDKFEEREVNGAKVYTNFQKENESKKCEFLNLENGRCGIHKSNPFSCEFELNKFVTKGKKTYLMNKLFGRGWAMMRVDGERGALCKMISFNPTKYARDIEMLVELMDICKKMSQKVPLLKKVVEKLSTIKKPIENQIVFTKNEKPNYQKRLL
jgi:Fe-S-cluster containining protein